MLYWYMLCDVEAGPDMAIKVKENIKKISDVIRVSVIASRWWMKSIMWCTFSIVYCCNMQWLHQILLNATITLFWRQSHVVASIRIAFCAPFTSSARPCCSNQASYSHPVVKRRSTEQDYHLYNCWWLVQRPGQRWRHNVHLRVQPEKSFRSGSAGQQSWCRTTILPAAREL